MGNNLYTFGAGELFAVQNDIDNGVPIRIATLQDISIEDSGDQKELYGSGQYPIEIARGKRKLTGKAKFNEVNALAIAALHYGLNTSTGRLVAAVGEAGVVPSASAYTLTAANAATFDADLGVYYTLSMQSLTRVTGTPAAGEYAESAGVYTFAEADAGLPVGLCYTYTVAGQGKTVTVTNPRMGDRPTFMITFQSQLDGKQVIIRLNRCVSSKFSFSAKLDDYASLELDFAAMDDGTGNIMKWAFAR